MKPQRSFLTPLGYIAVAAFTVLATAILALSYSH